GDRQARPDIVYTKVSDLRLNFGPSRPASRPRIGWGKCCCVRLTIGGSVSLMPVSHCCVHLSFPSETYRADLDINGKAKKRIMPTNYSRHSKQWESHLI